MRRIFVPPEKLRGERVVLAGEDYRYLSRVLRARIGDGVDVFDGAGLEYRAIVTYIGPRMLELRVEGRREAAPSPETPRTTLIVGLPKGDKMDWVVQKATELGVARIVPVSTARAVRRSLDARAATQRQRLLKIVREAARQCGRSDVPEVCPVLPLADALAGASSDPLRLLFWEDARTSKLRERMPAERPAAATLAIGPEGGFSEEEVEAARGLGFQIVGLGPRTLRAETAAIAALAIVGYVLGDLG
jgi:16S rRNA (uracil1498-N3)-methyltransferase